MTEPHDLLGRVLENIRRLEWALEAGELGAARREYASLQREAPIHAWLPGYLEVIRSQLESLRQEMIPDDSAGDTAFYVSWFTDWPEVAVDDGETEPLDVGGAEGELPHGVVERFEGYTTVQPFPDAQQLQRRVEWQTRIRQYRN